MCVNTRRRISFFWLGHRRARSADPSSRFCREKPLSICQRWPYTPPVTAPPRPPAEAFLHLAAVFRLGLTPAGVAAVQGEHRGSGSSAAPGRRRDYVRRRSRCRPTACPTRSARPRAGRGLKLRRVLAGALADVGRQEQMAGRLQHRRQLGPGQAAATLALPPDEVAAAVPALVAGGVNGGPRLGRDQAAILRRADGLAEEGIDPFFSRRRPAAFWRVE